MVSFCLFSCTMLIIANHYLPIEICQDVKEECEKYGKVIEIKVPRPSGGRQVPGVGKIFVKFEEPESAQVALKALAGRKFADRTVVVTYFGEVCQSFFIFFYFLFLASSFLYKLLFCLRLC